MEAKNGSETFERKLLSVLERVIKFSRLEKPNF